MSVYSAVIKKIIDLSDGSVGETAVIKYCVKRSRRARTLRLVVYPDGEVAIVLPLGMAERKAIDFIRQKSEWVLKRLKFFKENRGAAVFAVSRREYQQYREAAFLLARRRLEFLNRLYNFKYQRISIRCQKTRWGSCSRGGNLSFNYKIALMPARFADYILTHELCHLAEFNHSPRFWALVAKAMPDYKIIRQKLRRGNIGV